MGASRVGLPRGGWAPIWLSAARSPDAFEMTTVVSSSGS